MSDKNIKVRGIITIVIIAVALFYLMPSITQKLPSLWKDYTDKIHLGLDLQGGMHLVMEVETEKAVESAMERTSNDLKELLMEKRVRFKHLDTEEGIFASFELPDEEASSIFKKLLKDNFPNLEIKSSEIENGREKVYLKIDDKQIEAIEKFAVEQSLETIRNRVDEFGVSEPEIIPQGKDRILIQLPGVKDPQRAINLIGKTALLEFKLVDDEHSLDEAVKGKVPPGDIVAYGVRVEADTGRRLKTPYLLKKKTLLTGEALEDAKVSISNRFG
ncbi:MAG TPA: protein translocase subunit SecD, partial [Syntrophales bacterium]|nr:protein translocase subunit SecD [Syntrophales bacterium]